VDIAELVAAHRHSGGPGAFSVPYQRSVMDWTEHRDWHLGRRRSFADAEIALTEAVRALCQRDLVPVSRSEDPVKWQTSG
jgi:hypothetical protein